MQRQLLVTRRNVRQGDRPVYDERWVAFHRAAAQAGFRVWRYAAAGDPESFIEFLEWVPDPVASGHPGGLSDARTALDEISPGTGSDAWVDASTGTEPPARERLRALVRERSLRRGDFVLASGARSTYYIDARVTTMSGEGQRLIGETGLDLMRGRGWSPACVGGLTLGADPIAYAIAHAAARGGLDIDAFTVRKQAKQHGTGRRIEGAFSTEGPVLVVEDVITTGDSALQAVEVLREAGARILGVLALVDRMEGGRARIESQGLEVASVFTTAELLAE